MDINILREAVTVLSFAGFLGIVAFAVNPRNKARFEEAARIPMDDEESRPESRPADIPPSQPSPKGEGAIVGQGFARSERQGDAPPPQPSPEGEGAIVGSGFAGLERK